MTTDILDLQAEQEGLAIKRLSFLRPHRTLNEKTTFKGKQTHYPYVRGKMMATPKNETKEAKFVRLATARMNKALKTVSLIGNLSNAQYGYTDDQVAKIEAALYSCVENTMSKFNKATIAKPVFDFSSPVIEGLSSDEEL